MPVKRIDAFRFLFQGPVRNHPSRSARTALEIATQDTPRRTAFGVVINTFPGVSFQVAEAAMLLDAAQAMGYATCSYQKQCNSIDSYDI